MKTTEWYPGKVKPVRVGLYQRKLKGGGVLYSWWDGRVWMTENRWRLSVYQSIKWRGLKGETK